MSSRPVLSRRVVPRIGSFVLASVLCLSVLGPDVLAQDPFARTIVVPLPDSSAYAVRKDLTYRTRKGEALRMDIFRPVDRKGEAVPGVIFVHGGYLPDSVAGKDTGALQSFGKFVTGVGLAGIVFSHGLTGPGTFQRSRRDVEAAVRHVRERASNLGLDRDRLCLAHFSLGGAFLAPFLAERPDWLKCIVLYYPVVRPGLMGKLTDGAVAESQREGLDPFSHIRSWEGAPALFLAEAGKDAPAINAGLRRFRDKAVEAGWPVEYWTHPTGPHGFDIADPSARSRAILRRTRSFLKEQLLGER